MVPTCIKVIAVYLICPGLLWFDLDENRQLRCIDESIPLAIDVHCHLGMSVLFKPQLDLQAKTDRVMHLLDSNATDPGQPLDLEFILTAMSPKQHLMNCKQALLRRVSGAASLPALKPFPTFAQMRQYAASGARIIKLHPTVQRFYPDDPAVMDIYAEAEKLGLVIFFHGGRAGIEPDSSHPYAMPRHYEAPMAVFPNLQFILGHAGARDNDAMLELALRHENAWLGIHGQSLSHLEKMIQRTGGERLLFGTDWPFYHLGASLAKVLITTNSPSRGSV